MTEAGLHPIIPVTTLKPLLRTALHTWLVPSQTCVSANEWKMRNPHHSPRTNWSWKTSYMIVQKRAYYHLKLQMKHISLSSSSLLLQHWNVLENGVIPLHDQNVLSRAALPLDIPSNSSAEQPRQKLLFYKTLVVRVPRDLVPAFTKGPGFSWLLNGARRRGPKAATQSHLSPHEGFVGSANDEIGPDDVQDLQGHQEPVEQPPRRVRTDQLPAFEQGCIQNPKRDPETHFRSAVPVKRLPALH